jgi:3-hydroxybutyryl-CoA dehydratase
MSKTFDQLAIGDTASVTRTIAARDIDLYAELTDDYNPVHMDEAYAKTTVFGGRIAHGTITLGLIAPVIGMKLPGQGSVLLEITSKFFKPVKIGDAITASATVSGKDEQRRNISMTLRFVNQRGEEVALGEARVKPPKATTG